MKSELLLNVGVRRLVLKVVMRKFVSTLPLLLMKKELACKGYNIDSSQHKKLFVNFYRISYKYFVDFNPYNAFE